MGAHPWGGQVRHGQPEPSICRDGSVERCNEAAGTDVVRSHAERAGAQITEVDGSHVIMGSQPDAVVQVIEAAIAAVS
jgi:hypothetical protein